MKVLFINTGPWGTGSFTAIKGLAKELLKMGHQVKIFFPDAHLKTRDLNEYYAHPELYHVWQFPIHDEQITLPTFPLMLTDPHPRNPQPILFKDMTEQEIYFYNNELKKELSSLLSTFAPDVIECHHIWYASWILSQMKANYFLTAHHSDQMGFRLDKKVRPYAIEGAIGGKKIFAISTMVKEEVKELYKIPESKIVISENGYDKTIFRKKKVNKNALLSKFNIQVEQGATFITCVGKVSFNKGIDVLLQANKQLKDDLHFLIIGAGEVEPLIEKLQPLSYSLNNVHFLGQQSPEVIADFHNISKFSLMPSRSEGFGIACLEAMACGIPVIASKSGGPEAFAVGLIIDKNSPQQLAKAIQTLIDISDKKYEELCKQALHTAQKFSWEKILKKRIKAYEEVLSSKGI